jgi:predicted dienelactone hydrolase
MNLFSSASDQVANPRRFKVVDGPRAVAAQRARMRARTWRLVVVGLALSVGGSTRIPARAADTEPGAATPLSLPAPTGALRVGTATLHLIDDSRIDPLAPTPRWRELMVRLWYPAAAQSRQPHAAYLTPGVARVSVDFLRAVTGVDLPNDLLSFATHSLEGAPALPGTRRPVVLFSHGLGISAALNTALHEELASRGYVVAGIDHTFDCAVEFPDGRVEVQKPGLQIDDLLREVRAADLRFVLDQLTALAAGHNPDAGLRPLPEGLARTLDVTRVGAYGHSLGGPTVIGAMNQDRRIDAGAALDGTLRGPVSFKRPFLMMGNQHERRADDPDWAAFFDQLRGPRLHLVIDGAEHSDLTDMTVFKSAVDISAVFTTGPIDGERAVLIQRRYLVAWFDWALRGRARPLLGGESRRFPEVVFQP